MQRHRLSIAEEVLAGLLLEDLTAPIMTGVCGFILNGGNFGRATADEVGHYCFAVAL